MRRIKSMPDDRTVDAEGVAINRVAWRILPWLMNLIVVALLGWATKLQNDLVELHSEMQTLREWKSEVMGTHYSAKDHSVYAETQAKELAALWKELAALQQTWLKDLSEVKIMLARMPTKDDISGIDQRLREHMEREKSVSK